MGFLDDMRRVKKAAEEQPEGLSSKERIARAQEQLAADDQQAFRSEWAVPGWEWPYVEAIDATGVGSDMTWRPPPVVAYLAIVGIRPEDTFAVWPTNIGDSGAIFELTIAYRDRPEYASGRERYAAWREQS